MQEETAIVAFLGADFGLFEWKKLETCIWKLGFREEEVGDTMASC